MDYGEQEKKKVPEDTGSGRYYVLFVQTLKQWEVGEVIRRTLPKGRGTVFYPCVELWMRSLGQTVIEPMFPGYVFIRSALSKSAVHAFVREIRWEVLSFVKELGIRRNSGEEFAEEVTDLAAEETEFLDFMLGFRYGDSGSDFIETKPGMTDTGKRIYRRKLPKAGVLAMSCGYREADGRYVVMEGPLAGYGDKIVDVNPKERRAYLNIRVGDRLARVGFELKSRRHWYPKDKDETVMLEDGFVINPKDIAAAIMRPKH